MTIVTLFALLGIVAIMLASLLMLSRVARQDRLAARIRYAQGLEARTHSSFRSPFQLVAELGSALARSGFLSARTVAELEQTLILAGFRSANGLSFFVGGKLLGFLIFPTIAWIVAPRHLMGGLLHYLLPAAAGVLGLLMPDMIVRRLRESYVRDVERGLPDALDMMVICAEAGLGLTAAIGRVGAEIRPAHPAVADELLRTADELHVVADARVALTNLGNRTGLAALKQLGGALIQSQQYGTPLSEALRALAAEMRQMMMTRFEERAAKLPALLTVPMILFILPATFIVVGGPAVIQVLRVMRH